MTNHGTFPPWKKAVEAAIEGVRRALEKSRKAKDFCQPNPPPLKARPLKYRAGRLPTEFDIRCGVLQELKEAELYLRAGDAISVLVHLNRAEVLLPICGIDPEILLRALDSLNPSDRDA